MPPLNEHDPVEKGDHTKDSLEAAPFSTEDKVIVTDTKVDQLIDIAAEVKRALTQRSIYIALAIIIPLMVGTILMFQVRTNTVENQRLVRSSYMQNLESERDFLEFKKVFAETRDCPVKYFQDLLRARQDNVDITTIDPPCKPIDIEAIDQAINRLDREIDRVENGG